MRKYNNFSHCCQYKSINSSVIITPSVIYAHPLLTSYNLAAKHAVVLCHFLLSCWREQPSWFGEEHPTLDSMLSRPIRAKMLELDYAFIGKVLCLSKTQLKDVLIDLEAAKLLRRVIIKNKWYVLLSDEAFRLFLNNNKSKKHRINKGNVISTSWLNTLKTDNDQTDFAGVLILGEIVYFSRVFKRKKETDEYFENEYHDSGCFDDEQQILLLEKNKEHKHHDNDKDYNNFKENNTVLLSKSSGLIPYFSWDHFKKKFPFLDNQTINRALARLEKNNIISVQREKFTKKRKVIKRLYIAPNYQIISKGVNKTIVDFVFKTKDYLSSEQLAGFYQNTPPSLYYIYNNKTIIYPEKGFSNNFASFSSLLTSNSMNCIDLAETFKQVSSKRWYQEDSNSSDHIANYTTNHNSLGIHEQSKHEVSSIESLCIKKRAFIKPKCLLEIKSSLKRLYKAYFASFDYPLSFCFSLLESLSKKYPSVSFKGENQFITYFRKILAQEKRASWQVRSRKYFEKALSLADLAYDKLPNLLKDKLNKLALEAGKKIEELPELLCKLAIKNAKHLFSCVSSFLSYMKQVLFKLKNKEEIQEAYKALPRVGIAEVSIYLSKVEASYHRVGPQEHLRRKLASTLPMTIAYHLLHSCNFYSAKVDDEENFIIPSKNKNWAEMLRGGLKKIIKDQVAAVYGQIKTIKFVGFLRREDAAKEELTSSADVTTEKSTSVNEKETEIVSRLINKEEIVSSYSGANSNYCLGARNEQSRNNTSKNETRFISYELFQKKRLELEKKEQEELKARMSKEEQELKASNTSLEIYEKYKQAMEQVEMEKKKFLIKGGKRELAKELYKYPSFGEWLQLQELIEVTH